MFDVDNLEHKNAVLKFMNVQDVSFDELQIILDLKILEINSVDDPYDFWREVASANLGGEFSKFYYNRGNRNESSVCTVDGVPFDYKMLNEWCSRNYKEIECEGGEGEGEYAHVVVEHLPSGRFLKITGSYYSYDGFNWEDCDWVEVKPTQVMVTKYL